MVELSALWLPILASAVFVFLASSVLHMLLPLHRGDFGKLPAEEEVLAAMRKAGVRRGSYMFPCGGSMKEMSSPEMLERLKRGPVGTMTVLQEGGFSIGKNLAQWFVFCLVIGTFVAYLTGLALPAGAEYDRVFRVAGSAALLGYAFTNVTDSIWKGVSWGTTAKFVFDGVVYGLVTAGTFGWLWPAAV